MQAATHEPRRVGNHHGRIVADLVFALDDMNSSLPDRAVRHASFPTTASIAPRSDVTVNGLVT